MIINEIALDGFLCFRDKKITINSDNAVIFGGNGSGKSALIDAISFALYGKSVRDIQLINKEAERANISLIFTLNDSRYTINRTINDDQTAKFLKDDIEFNNKEIYNIFGSFDDFLSKCVVKQDYLKIIDYDIINALKETFHIYEYDKYDNEITKRLENKSSMLKELEKEIDNINSKLKEYETSDSKEVKRMEKEKTVYERALEKAKRRLAQLEKKEESAKKTSDSINELNAKITILTEELKNKEDLLKRLNVNKEDYNALKREYNEFIRLRNKIMLLEKKRVRYEILTNTISLLKHIIEEKSSVSTQLSNDLKSIKQRYKDSNLELKRLREDMIKLDKSKIELENKRYRLDAEINLAKEQLNTIVARVKNTRKSKKCPICNQSLVNIKELITHMTDESNEIKKEIKNKEKELSNVMIELRQVDSKIHQVEMMIAKAETTTKSMVEDLEKRAMDVKNELETLNSRLSKSKKELLALKFDPKSYEKDRVRYEQLVKSNIIEKYVTTTSKFNEWQALNQNIKKIKGAISLLNKRLNSLAKIDVNTIYNEITNTREEIVRLDTKIEEYNLLLAKRKGEIEGLKTDEESRLLKNRLDELNSSINDTNAEIEALNELRSILNDTLLSIINETIDAIKPYTKELDLQFEFKDNNLFINHKEFANLSRGEKAFIYLILRVAYMQALNTPLIIIDNNLSMIDKDKIKLLISNINAPLLVLTHQDLRPFFSKVIEL